MMRCNRWLILAFGWFLLGVYGLIFHEATKQGALPFLHFDKMVHGFLFFIQIWLLCKWYLYQQKRIPYASLVIFSLVYAIASEWAQAAFTLTRQADVYDGIMDILGAMIALCVARKSEMIRKT